jgi:hypothetical protein
VEDDEEKVDDGCDWQADAAHLAQLSVRVQPPPIVRVLREGNHLRLDSSGLFWKVTPYNSLPHHFLLNTKGIRDILRLFVVNIPPIHYFGKKVAEREKAGH